MNQLTREFTVRAIGIVSSSRTEVVDDNWGSVISTIQLDPSHFSVDAVKGLDAFSHLEVIYYFDRVKPEEIHRGARHPRNRKDWPEVGVFAQRVKAGPNLLGVSRCKLLSINGLELTVQGLDAIDGTPVLDIKPYMREFGPIGDVHEPEWAVELMREYYK